MMPNSCEVLESIPLSCKEKVMGDHMGYFKTRNVYVPVSLMPSLVSLNLLSRDVLSSKKLRL